MEMNVIQIQMECETEINVIQMGMKTIFKHPFETPSQAVLEMEMKRKEKQREREREEARLDRAEGRGRERRN